MNTQQSEEIQEQEEEMEISNEQFETIVPEAPTQQLIQKRLSAVGITRPNKKESKARRKMAAASRKKNWSK